MATLKEFRNHQDEKADGLAQTLSEFNAADEEYRAHSRKWTESNAQEGSAMWKKLEAKSGELYAERHEAAKSLLVVIEGIAMVRHSVVSTRETTS